MSLGFSVTCPTASFASEIAARAASSDLPTSGTATGTTPLETTRLTVRPARGLRPGRGLADDGALGLGARAPRDRAEPQARGLDRALCVGERSPVRPGTRTSCGAGGRRGRRGATPAPRRVTATVPVRNCALRAPVSDGANVTVAVHALPGPSEAGQLSLTAKPRAPEIGGARPRSPARCPGW